MRCKQPSLSTSSLVRGDGIEVYSGTVPGYTQINGTSHLVYSFDELFSTKEPWTRIYLHTISLYLILRQQVIVRIWIKEILPKDYQLALPIQTVFHHTHRIYQLQAAPCL